MYAVTASSWIAQSRTLANRGRSLFSVAFGKSPFRIVTKGRTMTPHEFAKAGLDDCQLTIRALDVKCGAVLLLLLAPLTSISRIFEALSRIPWHGVAIGGGLIFFALWGLSLLSLMRGLAPLDNPAHHIRDHTGHVGTYYRGGLYSFGFWDALLNRSIIMSSKNVASAVADLPNTDADVGSELTFEHMKLCYIRDVKIKLLKWGIWLAEAWLVWGTVVYLVARYAK